MKTTSHCPKVGMPAPGQRCLATGSKLDVVTVGVLDVSTWGADVKSVHVLVGGVARATAAWDRVGFRRGGGSSPELLTTVTVRDVVGRGGFPGGVTDRHQH